MGLSLYMCQARVRESCGHVGYCSGFGDFGVGIGYMGFESLNVVLTCWEFF